MMVERKHFIITITSSFLLLSLFYKVLPPQNRNDVDLDGFQNDPAIYEAFECPSGFERISIGLPNKISFGVR